MFDSRITPPPLRGDNWLSVLPHEIREEIFKRCVVSQIMSCCAQIVARDDYTQLEHLRENYMSLNLAYAATSSLDRDALTSNWKRIIKRCTALDPPRRTCIVSNVAGNLDIYRILNLCNDDWRQYCVHCNHHDPAANSKALARCAFLYDEARWLQLTLDELTQQRGEYRTVLKLYDKHLVIHRSPAGAVDQLIREILLYDNFLLHQPCRTCRAVTANYSGYCDDHYGAYITEALKAKIFV